MKTTPHYLPYLSLWLPITALSLCLLLSGCQTPLQALQQLAVRHEHRVETLSSQPFALTLATPQTKPATTRLRVYLEGDGHAWATATQPSLDPTPRTLLLARLALQDPTPSVYLARPCQYLSLPGCTSALWTHERFSKPVLQSLDQALSQLKARYGNQDFELIGYSGGGALALLLAARRDDIAQVQTLAGNLSPRQWVTLKQLSPLYGSLDPLDYRERLSRLPQRHFVGNADTVVPPALLDSYRESLGSNRCIQTVLVQSASHGDGWDSAWQQWRDQPLECR